MTEERPRIARWGELLAALTTDLEVLTSMCPKCGGDVTWEQDLRDLGRVACLVCDFDEQVHL